ncbi:MAG: hypothetical protein ACX932_01670 [Gammaproteobacteria bacterium]
MFFYRRKLRSINRALYGHYYDSGKIKKAWLDGFIYLWILASTVIISVVALTSLSVIFSFPVWGSLLFSATFFGLLIAQGSYEKHPLKKFFSLMFNVGILNHLRLTMLYKIIKKRHATLLKQVISRYRENIQNMMSDKRSRDPLDKVMNDYLLSLIEEDERAIFMRLQLTRNFKKNKNRKDILVNQLGSSMDDLDWFIEKIQQEKSFKKIYYSKMQLICFAAVLSFFSGITSGVIVFNFSLGLIANMAIFASYGAFLPYIAALLGVTVGVSAMVGLFYNYQDAIINNRIKQTAAFFYSIIYKNPMYSLKKFFKKHISANPKALWVFENGVWAGKVAIVTGTLLLFLSLTVLIAYCGFGASLSGMSHTLFFLVNFMSIHNSLILFSLQIFTFINAIALAAGVIIFGTIQAFKATTLLGESFIRLMKGNYDIIKTVKAHCNAYIKNPLYLVKDFLMLNVLAITSLCVALHSLLTLGLLIFPSQHSPLVRSTLPKYVILATVSGAIINVLNRLPAIFGVREEKDIGLARELLEDSKNVIEHAYTAIQVEMAYQVHEGWLSKSLKHYAPKQSQKLRAHFNWFLKNTYTSKKATIVRSRNSLSPDLDVLKPSVLR